MGTLSMEHDERLSVPWWGWLLALGAVTVFIIPFGLAAADPVRWAAFAVPPVTAVALWWLGRIRVAVTKPRSGASSGSGADEDEDELRVDDARLPLRFIAKAVPLDPAGRSALLGPGADPLAFVVQRPWIPGAVQVVLDDPADPTPYWLVSTRHPERLARLLDPGSR